MSVQAISWACSVSVGDPIQKFVLVALANYSDDFGVCWPSQATLTEVVECSERKLRNCLDTLEASGLIKRIERRRPNGSRRSNAYLLVGFEGRRRPLDPGDHPIVGPQDVGGSAAAATINRHGVPLAATGTTCRCNRHHVPLQPAPRAPLEPSSEPSRELTPLSPPLRASAKRRERTVPISSARRLAVMRAAISPRGDLLPEDA